MVATCYNCGYQWLNRKPYIKYCTYCHSENIKVDDKIILVESKRPTRLYRVKRKLNYVDNNINISRPTIGVMNDSDEENPNKHKTATSSFNISGDVANNNKETPTTNNEKKINKTVEL